MDRVRKNALVDDVNWQDTGCPDGMLPSCLVCPLPHCRFEYPCGAASARKALRTEQALHARAEGMGVSEIAEHFGMSRRTVFRIFAARGS